MQNLPITATPPASPAQQTVSTDSNATQAAEPFSNVLARQRANASTPNAGVQGSKQATPSSTGNASPASGNEQPTELQAADTTSISLGSLMQGSLLPGEMLAALLPAPSVTESAASSEKTVPLAPTPNAANALPGDILAALLPSATASSVIVNEKDRLRDSAPDEASTLPGDMLAALISAPATLQERSAAMYPQPAGTGAGGVVDLAGQKLASANIQGVQSLPRTQNNKGPAAMVTAAAQDNTFSAALEVMGKEGTKTAQLAASAAEFSAQATQPDPAANLPIQTQSSTASFAANPNGPAQAVVKTPVTHDAWGNEFSQKITWLATQHTQSAELHLNPPQLGPLDVVINVSGDQATALFTSPHAAVRDAVEQALPRLREMLADNGIMLGNATVSDQSPKEQQAWLAGQQQNGRENLSEKTRDTADGILSGSTVLPVRRHQGIVDTFA